MHMNQNQADTAALTLKVHIAPESFRAFAVFDVFTRLRRWVPMATFTGIMTVFAVLCFLLRAKAEQATLLGVVLLVVGLGLPAIYIKQFYTSVKGQIKKLGITGPTYVYALSLTPEALLVETARGAKESFPWTDMHGAYRNEKATYLYVSSTKAYIMPDDCVENPQALWQFLSEQLPAEKLHPIA